MVGGDADQKSFANVLGEQLVEATEEAVGHLAARRLLVLDVVGQADVEQVEPDPTMHRQADLHRIVTEVPVINPWMRPSNQPLHVGNVEL